MEQQEKQAIHSQRLRRAVTCMKRKEREGGEDEEGDEEEMPSPAEPKKRARAANRSPKRGGEGTAAGGGFLGSEVTFEPCPAPLRDVGSSKQETPSGNVRQPTAAQAQRSRKSSSSDDDSDSDDGGGGVAMVTARPVFEGSRRGRRGKSTRGRGSVRGRGRGKNSSQT